jgi:integrase
MLTKLVTFIINILTHIFSDMFGNLPPHLLQQQYQQYQLHIQQRMHMQLQMNMHLKIQQQQQIRQQVNIINIQKEPEPEPEQAALENLSYENITLGEALKLYIETISTQSTKVAYRKGLTLLFKRKFMDESMRLSEFAKLNHGDLLIAVRRNDLSLFTNRPEDSNLDSTAKKITDYTCQTYTAQFLSFVKYLRTKTNKSMDEVEVKKNKVFRKQREVTAASVYSNEELKVFLKELKKDHLPSYYIANMQLIGCRRIEEVCCLEISDINWLDCNIKFTPLKTRTVTTEPVEITFTSEFLVTLKQFINGRTSGYVFPKRANTNTRGYIAYYTVWTHYNKILKKLNMAPKSSTHSFRATGINILFNRGVSNDLIKHVTKHSNVNQISYYDKRQNQAKRITGDLNVQQDFM